MTDGRPGPTDLERPARPDPGLRRRLVDGWLAPIRVAAEWPGGKRRLVRRIVVVNLVDALALYLVARALPGVEVRSIIDAFLVTVLVALLAIVVRPAVLLLTKWSTLVAFVITLGLNAGLLQVAAFASEAFQVGSLIDALVTAFGVTVINSVIAGLLSLDEEQSFYGNVIRRMSRDRGVVDDAPGAGVVMLQIDGLAAPVLRHAVRTGVMPYVAQLVRSGSHQLLDWACDLPSMTSSSQAGILHGNNDDIPAFRWYEKTTGRLMISNRPGDAAEIERRVRGEGDLLAPNGTSVANLVSGGAQRALLTTSRVHVSAGLVLGGRAADELYGYLVNPYSFFRALFQTVATVLVEWHEARRQRLREVEPRMDRGGVFPLLRAASSVILRDLTTTAVIEDMQRGVPCIYADLLAYDEIAHHAGPERPESMRELEAIDRQIRTIVRAARGAPRPYRFVLLSDHGQSLGATFRQRYGEDLQSVLARLAADDATVTGSTGDVESWGPVNALLTELTGGRRVGARVARTVLRGRQGDEGAVELGPSRTTPEPGPRPGDEEMVVCASGNLALVYFSAIEGRATAEEIEQRHPRLIERLAAHPGVGIVLVRSASRGAVAVGGGGVNLLDERRVQGDDPLAVFGPLTADRLRRLDAFRNVGDLVVISRYDPATEEVAAFEELIGSHGGLGGPQTEGFLLVPADWPTPAQPIVGAVAVNERLRAWIAAERRAAQDGVPQPADVADAAPASPASDRVAAFSPSTAAPDRTRSAPR